MALRENWDLEEAKRHGVSLSLLVMFVSLFYIFLHSPLISEKARLFSSSAPCRGRGSSLFSPSLDMGCLDFTVDSGGFAFIGN